VNTPNHQGRNGDHPSRIEDVLDPKPSETDEAQTPATSRVTQSPSRGARALRRLRPTLLALPPQAEEGQRVNLSRAVTYALRVAQSYREDRAKFAAAFRPDPQWFDAEAHDDLAERALALRQADLMLRMARDQGGELQQLVAEGVPLRKLLVETADYLWDEEERKERLSLRGGRGYIDVADDLGTLALFFRERWTEVEGRSQVTEASLRRAEELGELLAGTLFPVSAGGANESDDVLELRSLRNRAAYHVMVGMEKVRQAAAFVHHGDPERLKLYPSFFLRVRRRSPSEDSDQVDEAEDDVLDPVEASAEDPALGHAEPDADAEPAPGPEPEPEPEPAEAPRRVEVARPIDPSQPASDDPNVRAG
jgi:hypothetical protein